MKKIKNRQDIGLLVNEFYIKIRSDTVLGPIFNAHIPKDAWPKHLEKLTDFWESHLLKGSKFEGNPTLKHIVVDHNMNHSLDEKHFDYWLQLWFSTIDTHFDGTVALLAKEAATRMAKAQFMAVIRHR